nr:MAG TPA: Photosystem II protein D1 [Caudoviricetes sp.]
MFCCLFVFVPALFLLLVLIFNSIQSCSCLYLFSFEKMIK